MRVLERCLPRNDIVRELAPYLQHVHRDDGDDESRQANGMSVRGVNSIQGVGPTSVARATSTSGTSGNRPTVTTNMSSNNGAQSSRARDNVRTPRDCDFVPFGEGNSVNSNGSHRQPPLLHSSSVDPLDAVDELVGSSANRQSMSNPSTGVSSASQTVGKTTTPLRKHLQPPMAVVVNSPREVPVSRNNRTTLKTIAKQPNQQETNQQPTSQSQQQQHETHTARSASAMTVDGCVIQDGALQKKTSAPKIKTTLGEISPVRWEKVVLVQVSVQGFREMSTQAKDLMEEAKMLYEHTVLSRLSTEYGGQEVLSQSRSGLFVIAFASEFHAAKWCLSLQLSLVYAAWNDKLLKQFADMREEHIRLEGRGRKQILLYRGFRVRMVIHAADSDAPTEKSLADAVKWTNTVSEFAHGGQIVLSDSVWDRLKEQLVQLGNPVVEDLGCHLVLDDEEMLMLLLPRDLEFRRFDKLKSPFPLAPGMRDAPSAHKPLTMVFTFIEGARPLVRSHAEELAERIKALCLVARELLRKHNGYECQELQGDFMLAFFNPVCAVMWATEFQLRIRAKFREWNRESENKELMFSMSMGIETGIPASVSPHKTSGRADYFGNIVNQTARIAKAAHGGQVLIGGEAWNAFSTSPDRMTPVTGNESMERLEGSTIAMFKFHGYYAFKGISLPIALVEAIPIETPFTRGENIRILLSGARTPKSTLVEDGQKKAPAIANVPSEMVRLFRKTERERDTIRETELGSELGSIDATWDDTIPIVEEHGSYDDDTEVPNPMVNARLNHSGLMQALRSSISGASTVEPSPRALRSEKMDRS
jgi:class 3 adenylate cyclase